MLFDTSPSKAVLSQASYNWTAAWLPVWHCALLFALGAMWGLQFVLLKIATVAGLGELNILFTSMTLLAAGFLSAIALTGAWFRPSWSQIRFFLISGFLGFVLPLGAAILAAREISAGVIVLFEALTPVVAMTLALALRIETSTRRYLLSMTFAGFCLLCFVGPESISMTALGFVLIVPIASACDCLYVAARWPNELRPLQVVTGEAIGALVLLSLCLLFWPGDSVTPLSWTYDHWAVLLFVAISFLEAFLYFFLIRRAGAVFVSFASLISLFAGILFGIILIGESHPTSVWLAVGFAVLALYVQRPNGQQSRADGLESGKAGMN